MRIKLRGTGFDFRFEKQGASAAARLLSRGLFACALASVLLAAGCRTESGGGIFGGVAEPRSLRDVPAARLAFRFEPDVAEEALPPRLRADDPEEPLAGVRTDFETRRTGEALIRTVADPRGQRALALYGTGQTDTDFRIDLYSAEGQFIRNVLPIDLTGVFPAEVAWSPDGERVAFVGVRTPSAQTGPTPAEAPPEPAPPVAADPSVAAETPTPAASIPSVPVFPTEQIYVGDRDGYNLRPVTSRPGLIYFRLAWSPDGRTLAALACREEEWNARRDEGKLPAGRPRLVTPEGEERLLDDRLTDVAPVWSPDGSKVATAFEHELAVYDAAGSAPTAGGFPVADPLRAASSSYDARVFKKAEPEAKPGAADATAAADDAVLISFNPFVRLEWVAPETIFAQTAFVRSYRNEPAPTFKYQRWHVLHLSPQAALLTKESP